MYYSLKLFLPLLALSISAFPASGQILITPSNVGGQISMIAGQANQVFEIFISGSGQSVGGANLRIQIGEPGTAAPGIQVLDLIGDSSNSTFWTDNNQGQNVSYAANRQSAEASITTTDAQPSINAPNDPAVFARMTLDGSGFSSGDSFQIYFENILGNNLLDTQILDPSGNPISTSFGSATVHFTPVPEPKDGVLVVGLFLVFWRFYQARGKKCDALD
jgi:hypothetical protein